MTRATPGSARSRHRFFRSELFFPNRPNRFGLLSLQSLHASLNRCRFRNAYRDRVSNSYRVCQLDQACCALFGYAELLCHTVYRGIRRRNHCLTSHTQKLTPAAPSCQFSEAWPVRAVDFSTDRISPPQSRITEGEPSETNCFTFFVNGLPDSSLPLRRCALLSVCLLSVGPSVLRGVHTTGQELAADGLEEVLLRSEDQRLKLLSLYSTIVAFGSGLVPPGRAEKTGGTQLNSGCDLSEPWISVCHMSASASIMSAPVPRAA